MNVLQFLSPLAKSYSTLQSKQDVIRDMSVHNLEFGSLLKESTNWVHVAAYFVVLCAYRAGRLQAKATLKF